MAVNADKPRGSGDYYLQHISGGGEGEEASKGGRQARQWSDGTGEENEKKNKKTRRRDTRGNASRLHGGAS